jgi:iron complex transport system substrate-binding protein
MRAARALAAFLCLLALGAAPPRPRIVSLIPSLTEDLFAIGAGSQVVGVSQFTDYPAPAARLPQVSSYSSVDAEKVLSLHPDVVVGIPAQAALTADLRRVGLRTELLDDDSYADIFGDLAALGRISGHAREAAALAGRLRARAAQLEAEVPAGERPRVFVVLGVAPVYTAGDRSYIATLLHMAGARNAARGLRQAYGRYSAEALVAAQPDAVLTDTGSGLNAVLDRAPWNALRAVREDRVYAIDNADLLERPGPRFTEGLRWLIERLHPGARVR